MSCWPPSWSAWSRWRWGWCVRVCIIAMLKNKKGRKRNETKVYRFRECPQEQQLKTAKERVVELEKAKAGVEAKLQKLQALTHIYIYIYIILFRFWL
jgi:hypothetical protein